jgi:long-chain acyl-CoA synthetase
MKALTALLKDACRNDFSIKSENDELDGAAVSALSRSLEDEIRLRGVGQAEPIIVSIGNRARDIVGFYAAWRAGMVVVPLHESAPLDVLAQMKSAVGARFIIRDGRLEGSGSKLSCREIPNDTALIIFTSGTTGRPKGVMLSHERLAAKIGVLQNLLKFRADDHIVVPLQLTFIFGIWVSLLALMTGATLSLMTRFSVSGMTDLLRSGATAIGVVPTMLRSMQLNSPPAASALRCILTGGEPLLASLANSVASAFPRAQIVDLYGSTETGSCDFYLNVCSASEHGTIGHPTEQIGFRIVADDERECGIAEMGELRIASPFGMLGYFDDAATTTAAFDPKGFFRTGDLARKRADGLVELVGRRKEIISRGGTKISPLEIDAIFATHPDIAAVLCGGVPDDRLGETIHLLIVKRPGAQLDPAALRNWAATRMEKQKLPDVIHFVDALPLGRTGKADRAGVKRVALK